VLGRLLLSIVGVLVLTGCGQHGTPKTDRPTPLPPPAPHHTAGPTSSGSLDCSADILTHGRSPSYRVVVGAVALQAWPAAGVLHASADHTPGAPRLFAKTGLLVRAEVPSTITVEASPHHVVEMGWRNGSVVPTRRVVVPPCHRDGTSRWLAFPGGYWVSRPGCLTVTVRSRGRADSVRVAVGAPCP
jgi:hypothetical protein